MMRSLTPGGRYDLVVLGTLSASLEPARARLAEALLDARRRLVTVAPRTPCGRAAVEPAGLYPRGHGL